MEAIFYNIWGHYRGLDYAFLGGELTDLIGEWLKEERLNAPHITPSSTPPGPPAGNATGVETMLAKASEQQSMVEVDEKTVTSNPPLTIEDPVSELNSRVMVVQPLINLEEEPRRHRRRGRA